MDKVIELSLQEKVKLLGKVLLLAQVAESYTENKKALVSIKKIADEEKKLLSKSKYALVESDSRNAEKLISEFVDTVGNLIKNIKKVDEWSEGCKALESYIEKLTAQIMSDEKLLLPPAPPPEAAIKKVLNGAASKVKKLGDMLDKGVENIKKSVNDNISNIKSEITGNRAGNQPADQPENK